MNYKKVIYKEVQIWFMRAKLPLNIDVDINYNAKLQKDIHPEEYLRIYYNIGGKNWDWTERILLSKEQLYKKLNESFREIYYYYSNNILLGYFELDLTKKEVEIIYFGLLPNAIGKGIGKAMMNTVFNIIKKHNREIIILHTCSADSPQALSFYQKMGFEIYKTTKEEQAHIIF